MNKIQQTQKIGSFKINVYGIPKLMCINWKKKDTFFAMWCRWKSDVIASKIILSVAAGLFFSNNRFASKNIK